MPATVARVTSVEITKARGKSVSSHAVAKLETSNGAGRLNALPSTACCVVLSDMAIVT